MNFPEHCEESLHFHFQVTNAKLVTLESMEAKTSSSSGRGMLRLDPNTGKPDPTIVRLMITLVDPEDSKPRDRCYEWRIPDLGRWVAMDKTKSREATKTWKERLMRTINEGEMDPLQAMFLFDMVYRK